jgi:hypothetical protein
MQRTLLLGIRNDTADRDRDCLGDLVLNDEQICHGAVVAFGQTCVRLAASMS